MTPQITTQHHNLYTHSCSPHIAYPQTVDHDVNHHGMRAPSNSFRSSVPSGGEPSSCANHRSPILPAKAQTHLHLALPCRVPVDIQRGCECAMGMSPGKTRKGERKPAQQQQQPAPASRFGLRMPHQTAPQHPCCDPLRLANMSAFDSGERAVCVCRRGRRYAVGVERNAWAMEVSLSSRSGCSARCF
jgi:hypothetical protein